MAKRLMLDEALASRHLVTGDHYRHCPLASEADGLDTATAERIRALNDDYRNEHGQCSGGVERCVRDARVRRTLELLALPYSDHPNYLPEWRPQVPAAKPPHQHGAGASSCVDEGWGQSPVRPARHGVHRVR
ncbi:DUF6221 family protein [Streptomyces sp. NPDC005899]|uniref:DUF6221 family protein n=1 Tax=Streptomyces sp. NPDC005899 TaxID=3155716 RepID=UPI0033EED69E